MSWTLSRTVAEEFARGHRHIPVPDPVIVEAMVPDDAVFFTSDERQETELVLDPCKVRITSIAAYHGDEASQELPRP
jgi:hypothetical protein